MSYWGLLFLINLGIQGETADKKSPDVFGKEVFNLLQAGEFDKLEQYYITKAEFNKIIKRVPNQGKRAKDEKKELFNNWNTTKKTFLNSFNDLEADLKPDFTNAHIDSVTYSYIIPKHGKDENIMWPDSKNYEVDPSAITSAGIFIYFSDKNNSYKLAVFTINANGSWKFSPEVNKPGLNKINK